MHASSPLEFEQWLDVHEDELKIQAAESGLDRELDFDVENFLEREYEEYCAQFRRA